MHKENWDDLRYVLKVAETGSVSGAARALGVNHATVLRHVAGFEAAHGISLFDKTARGYTVPPEKLRILNALRDVEAAHDNVAQTIGGARAPLRGVVRVTSTDSLCRYVLPAALARIERQEAGLGWEILSSNLHLDLGRLHADLTVRPAEKLGDELRGIAAARMVFGHYRAPGAPDRWLGLSGALSRSVIAGWMAEALPRGAVTDGADSFLTLAGMVAAGLGQAVLPCIVGDGVPGLVRIRGEVPDHEVPVWVALHADLDGVPRLHAARRLLVEAIAADADRLAGVSG